MKTQDAKHCLYCGKPVPKLTFWVELPVGAPEPTEAGGRPVLRITRRRPREHAGTVIYVVWTGQYCFGELFHSTNCGYMFGIVAARAGYRLKKKKDVS